MTRHLGALLFAGAWLLLENPKHDDAHPPPTEWQEVRSYDTAFLCEQGRREQVLDRLKEEGTPRGIVDGRYRCERAERVPGK
jgi:hypothetical protein